MDIQNFSFSDGLQLSAFAMLVVFLILVILLFIVDAFKFLPRELKEKAPGEGAPFVKVSAASADDDEMAAMLMASILAKEAYKGNVRIKSIKRIS